ncbi:MAG: DUF4252 domain-containing protein [Tidjanibacter sp.]|nr:DUF4252 domain-containing protein [Tidjanibacter sp.]
MKRFYIFWVVVLMCLFSNVHQAQAQTPEFKKFMEAYTGVESITVMDVSSAMLRMAGFGANDKDAKELLSQLNRLVVITNENGFAGLALELEKVFQKGEYEVLTSITEGGSKTKICVKSGSRGENELVVLNTSGKKTVIVCVVGKLSVDQMMNISSGLL